MDLQEQNNELLETALDQAIRDRFLALPKIVREAIVSSDVEKHLREMSTSYRLHFDQWDKLENEVYIALLSIQPVEELSKNIERELGTDTQTAEKLSRDIENAIFRPIREELERTLEHPDAKEKELSTSEKAQAAVSVEHKTATIVPQAPTVARAPISDTYKPGETSTARPGTDGDPYREPVA